MKFNNQFYNQIKGTAMGIIFAPTYATLSMRYFEIKLYSKNNNPKRFILFSA